MNTRLGRIRRRLFIAGLIVVVAIVLPGCSGNAGRSSRTYTRSGPRDPVGEAKYILEGYVAGRGDNSDQTLVPGIVAAARELDPAKAAILEQGFADIAKAASQPAAAAIAKRVLGEL